MPSVKSRKAYQHVSDFDKGRNVAYRNFGLSYRSIAARIGRDPMTVSRICNQWFQDGNTERRTGSQRPLFTRSREVCYPMSLMDRAASSQALSQELRSFASQQVSAQVQQHRLSARRS
ncbi:HTH_Tnp_Tc3_2 domain-containing protein [Trichonephila clavipes]|nr:HTH_Tnp_Tc3_2 domain-containing protein [Trichonephila clavipes]